MTGFDTAELARLAEAATPGEVTVLGGWLFPYAIRVGLGAMRTEDAEFIAYVGTHRVAIVAALTRAQETEKAIERVRAVRLADSPGGHHYHYRDGFEDAVRAVIAALGGATTTTGDTE